MTTILGTSNNVPKRSIWALLPGFIDRPRSTLQAVLAQRRWTMWLAPLLVILISFTVLTVIQTPYTLEVAREQMQAQLATMPEEQAQAMQAGMGASLSLPVMLATSLGFGAIMLVVSLLAQATFLYFTALVAGGEMDFGSMFTVSAWSRLPEAISYLAQAGFTAAMAQLIRQPGLSFLVTTGDMMQDARNPFFGLLSRLDLFWLWHLLLVAVGLSVAARFGWGKSGLLTLLYAALVLALAILPTLLFSGMMGA